MRKTKRKVKTIAVLATIMFLSTSMGISTLNSVAGASSSLATKSIVSLQDATAEVTSYTVNPYVEGTQTGEKTVTGLLIDSQTAYSGTFSGVFNGSTTIEYKFPGTTQSSYPKTGDAMGNFYFRITSLANPDYWVQANIGPRYDKTNGYYVANGANIYFTGSTWGDNARWSNNANGQNKTLEYAQTTGSYGAPVFNSDSIDLNNKLYIDVDDNGVMKIGYNAFTQNTAGKLAVKETKAMHVVLDDATKDVRDDKMDLSQGYKISFGSNFDTTAKYNWVASSALTEMTPSDAGTAVCFIALNDEALDKDVVEMQLQDKQLYAENVYRKNEKNYINLNVGDDLNDISFAYREFYQFATSFQYASESTPSLTIDDSDIDWNSPKVGDAGKLLAKYNGLEEVFYVKFGESVQANDYGNVLLDDLSKGIATQPITVNKGADAAYGYSGLLVSSDEAYTGSFAGVFYDSTSIRYKFPGKSAMKFYTVPDDPTDPTVPLTESSVSRRGDGLGDFYFVVHSVAKPSQSFEIHITPSSTKDGLNAAQTAIYVKAKDTSGTVRYYYKSMGKDASASCTTSVTNAMSLSRSALFNSDLNAALGDFADNLYFDIDGNGIMSVYYDQRNTTQYWLFPSADNYGKYGQNENYDSPLVRFDASALGFVNPKTVDGPSSYGAVFDASQGYTISFGSNFDMNGTYLKPSWNYDTGKYSWSAIEDLSEYGVDGGTDVCFLSVGGVDLSQENVFLSSETNISYNGQYQDVVDAQDLVYTMAGLERLPTSHSILSRYGFSDNWCFDRSEAEITFSTKDMSGVNINEPGRYQASIEIPALLENVRPFSYNFYLEVQQALVLTLETNGGYIDGGYTSIKYAESMIPELPDAVWYGVEFLGWYLEPDYRTQVSVITKDLGTRTLYAKWLDEVSPVIILSEKASFEVFVIGTQNLVQKTDVFVTDNADGEIGISNVIITVKKPEATSFVALSDVAFNQEGQYIVKYTVQDSSGNTSSIERVIELLSNAGPQISVDGNLVETAYTNKNIIIPTATCDDGSTVEIKVSANGKSYNIVDGAFVADIAGIYTVCYYAKNSNGVESVLEYKVIVKDDEEAPVITIEIETMEILIGSTIQIPVAKVMDNADGELLPTIKVALGAQEVSFANNEFVAGQLGAYTITYTAEDEAGLKSIKQIVVYAREVVVNEDGDIENVPEPSGCASGCNGSLSGLSFSTMIIGLLSSIILLKKKKFI